MLFRYTAAPESDARMRAITERLIDAALACDGSYYLPYRPHATVRAISTRVSTLGRILQNQTKIRPNGAFSRTRSIKTTSSGGKKTEQERARQFVPWPIARAADNNAAMKLVSFAIAISALLICRRQQRPTCTQLSKLQTRVSLRRDHRRQMDQSGTKRRRHCKMK